MAVASRASIDRFLTAKRIAFIGLSRNPSDFSRHLYQQFLDRGYEVIPVNPKLEEVNGGQPCYASVEDIAPVVDAALVITSADASEQVVRECARAGIKRIWLHRATGRGSVSEAALDACRELDIDVVGGECPFLFLCGSKFPHNVHGWIKKLTFTYPQ